MTVEGFLAIAKIGGLAFIVGWFITLGMWAVCKMLNWAPVNLTVTVKRVDD